MDVATGVVHTRNDDVTLTGRLPFTFRRAYSSELVERQDGLLGPGWTTTIEASIQPVGDDLRLFTPEGNVVIFSGAVGLFGREPIVRNLGAFHEIALRDGHYVVTRWNVTTGYVDRLVFTKQRDGVARLSAIEDPTGTAVDIIRDTDGYPRAVRQRLEQRMLHFEYANSGRLTAVLFRPPSGAPELLAAYRYDGDGRLESAFDAASAADRFEYDGAGRLVREHLKDGGTFDFEYDNWGRCVRTSGAHDYDLKRLRFFPDIRWTEVVNSHGAITRYQWLANGQVVTEMGALGAVRRTVYDEHSRIVARVDPLGAVTQYEYDAAGNRSKITHPNGDAWINEFNEHHLLVRVVMANGAEWTRTYDLDSRLTSIADPLGGEWSCRYDAEGNLVSLTNPNGVSRTQTFGPEGMLYATSDWMGNESKYAFDHHGRVTVHVTPGGETTHFRYDAVGNPTRIEFADGTHVEGTYDSGGNLTSYVGPDGGVARYRYGTCGRLLERITPSGLRTLYRWGTEPRELKEVVNAAGQRAAFAYDVAGRLVHERLFDGRRLRIDYDLADRVIGIVDRRDRSTRYSLDALGRVVRETTADGYEAVFEYDCFGNVMSAVNPDAVVRFDRDAVGRVIRETQPFCIVETSYDAAGEVVRTKTSLGLDVEYRRDGNGRVVRVSVPSGEAVTTERDLRGNPVRVLLPGGVRLDQDHDPLGRLVSQTLRPVAAGVPIAIRAGAGDASADRAGSAGDVMLSREYRRTQSGAIVAVFDDIHRHRGYAYDPDERLVEAGVEGGVRQQFEYDFNGNVTVAVVNALGAEVCVYGPDDRLERRGSQRFIYDDDGRLLQRFEGSAVGASREWRFTWDDKHQLRSVVRPDGMAWRYRYDALGRRISKSTDGRTVHFGWDRAHMIHHIEERGSSSAWLTDAATGTPVFTVQDGRFYSIVTDALGAPRELLDARGEIAWSCDIEPWGEAVVMVRDERVECPLRFKGQFYDQESGLHYNRFRYYDPAIGRFISQDPIGLGGGTNLYAYARNPVNWDDPFGLAAGDLTAISDSQLKRMGVDAHALKQDFVPGEISRFNIAKNQDGDVFLVPVRKGGGEVVDTGLKVDELPGLYPREERGKGKGDDHEDDGCG